MDRVMVLPENVTVDDLENEINGFIDDSTCDGSKITIKDLKYVNNRYILIYENTQCPMRKFGIFKTQNKIDASISKIKEFLAELETATFEGNIDDIEIESFTIYEDHADRARDHAIILYSYNSYDNFEIAQSGGNDK